MNRPHQLIDKLGFPEGPRWRHNKLWFSDMGLHQVMTVNLKGETEIIVEVPQHASGLGWLPDGRLLIVSMIDKQLLLFENKQLSTFADLSKLAAFHCNDMVVSAAGNAYIGNFGYPAFGEGEAKYAEIIKVDSRGKASVVADDLAFPNGMVISGDGQTLIVAESLAARITAFSIDDQGNLHDRRIWAEFDNLGMLDKLDWTRTSPDGISMDEDGGIWVACPSPDGNVFRVVEGGKITDRIEVEMTAYACMLGGPSGKTLFILGTRTDNGSDSELPGEIIYLDVGIARAGLP